MLRTMAWYSVYEKVLPYVVRIDTADGFGTGFLFAYNKTRSVAALATASHVIQCDHEWRRPIKVWHPESKKTVYLQHDDRVIWMDPTHDAATIWIESDALKLPTEVLPILTGTKHNKVGVEVGWVGFPHLAPLDICFFSGPISVYSPSQDAYLIDGVAINGVSGGPVFSQLKDDVPQIIGVVSAYRANRRSGESLPGLLHAQDLTAFHDHLQKIKNMDDAKEKELEAQKKAAQAGKPTEGTPPSSSSGESSTLGYSARGPHGHSP